MQDSFTVSHTARIPVPAPRAYKILADYRDGHPRILPPAFLGLTVEAGGYGHGTRIAFSMRAFGRITHARADITEADPGRVLVETCHPPHKIVTTFTVYPAPGGCDVTIQTAMPLRPGIPGRIERWMTERYLLPIYRQELTNLAAVASSQ